MDFDIEALLDQAEQPEKTLQLCLRGDLRAQWEELEHQFQEARRQPRESLADDGGQAIAEQMAELEERMRSSTVTLRLRALPRREWKKLIEAHPPTTDVDKKIGINSGTFYDDLIAKCLVEPEMTGDQLARMLDVITSGQYDQLTESAWALNRRDVDVPFSLTASRITRNSDGTSRRQSDSASPTSGGAAGNRSKSRSTRTTKRGELSGQ